MSAFTPPDNSYPTHPNINGPGGASASGNGNGNSNGNEGLPVHPNQHQHQHQQQQHHGPPPYSYYGQPQHQPQQHPHPMQLQYENNNGHMNGHGHVNHVDDSQQMAQAQAEAQIVGSGTSTPGEGQKGNRLRKACDSCSIRKVKCDEAGPPCKACAALDIPCTFDRPSRRRGPPNRHAEAIKKRRLDSPSMTGGTFSSPTSPNNVAATLASFSSHAVLNAESICPFSTLELLVDDYFTYIHPLVPFPHEPSFRAAFKAREDLNNPPFLSLLAAMIGSLVASFPRNPRIHLKAQHRENLFPNSISLIERCHKVAVESRGAGYLDKQLNVYDAATSYLLGLSHAYTLKWKSCRLYFGETLTILRVVGAHKVQENLSIGALPLAYGAGPENGFEELPQTVDYVKQEIGRRIFWIMFLAVRSMQQLGASFGELLIPPPTPNELYPPYPVEVDDEYIYLERIDQQPAGIVSKLTGFNLACEIYMTVTPLATMEMAYGIDQVFDFNKQKKILEECLRSAKKVLDGVPKELVLLQPNVSGHGFNIPERRYFPPAQEYPGIRSNGVDALPWLQDASDARRELQYEIQKANIYVSQLGTRSYIVEKYWNLHESHERMKENSSTSPSVANFPSTMATGLDGMLPKQSPGSNYDRTESVVVAERENIVKNLLQVLGAISQVNMEPNGGSFINKIRQIASTLIDTPQNRKGPLALKTEEYLGKFLEVLMKLERVSPAIKTENGEVDEEEELRNWADLREAQMQFMQAGGFMNEIG
ncbi:putative transcriptional regulatory protein [Lachnellula occidentalis]|uniref:Putative transcriptional regulatory protein n=1 Tax=Lachnellula occidentalis TaxID=215460 RepID=A0A8H8RZX8_9HELO|nr:putative transcriptional regulatory protein [Lachnellula occidentalis]